ncbi:dihydrofolate reductase [Lambiella insularis]|nr:dihydrofolate reductase [Lambiella insularis]
MSSSLPHLPDVRMGPSSASLTLIVAATHQSLGIGRSSTLPWPALKSEMAYFARVTKRAPPHHINGVIMGRKTWESIPSKFRPLQGRVNVVVTRRKEASESDVVKAHKEVGGQHKTVSKVRSEEKRSSSIQGYVEGPYKVGSIEEGVKTLQSLHPPATTFPDAFPAPPPSLSRIFIIGGAEIYAAALKLPTCTRILLTRIYTDYECDTFFPIRLSDGMEERKVDGQSRENTDEHGSGEEGEAWVRRSKLALDTFAGERVPGGRREENQVEWEFEMWERRSDG